MRIGTGIRVEYFSSAWMVLEVISSIGVGLAAGSFVLLVFDGDSLVELSSGLVVLRHLRTGAGGPMVHDRRTELLTAGLLAA